MFPNLFLTVSAISMIAGAVLNQNQPSSTLSTKEISLKERYSNSFVNDVFADNILLNLAYLRGIVKASNAVDWNEVKKPFSYSFNLQPGEVFAYHDSLLPEYEGKVKLTTNAHFSSNEGFKSDGYLIGDGVCHLASLINWVAKDSGLESVAPTNHDFANIPQVPAEYGVAIYSHGPNDKAGATQNLYIRNNKNKEVRFNFEYDGTNLKLTIDEASSI